MAATLVRAYTCSDCGDRHNTRPGQRGPVPQRCPICKAKAKTPNGHSYPPPLVPAQPLATPFNSTPQTAPRPTVVPPAVATAESAQAGPPPPDTAPAVAQARVPSESTPPPDNTAPGPLETQLQLELDNLRSTVAMDGTLRMVALQIARLADQTPLTDVRSRMAALKEMRSIVTQLGRSDAPVDQPLEQVDEVGPFGACRPEITGPVDLGECVPRWATPRRYERPTWGPYFGRVAAAMGKPFMPWQQHAADLSGEVDHLGHLCYREVTITVPRQSGKTTLVLAVVVGRAEAGAPFGGRQNMLYAAQTQIAAVKKFRKEYIPDLKSTEVLKGKTKTVVGSGNPTVTFFSSGSTFATTPTKDDSSHGEVLDFGCLDEAFAQVDDVVEGAWVPAMITRRMAQMFIPSTAGDATSTYFRGKVVAGRKAAELDSGYGTAYIEYSADEKAPGFDPGDEALWRRVMPALGHTQPIEALRAIYKKCVLEGKINTWLRAFLNVWVDRISPPVFKAGRWEACHRPDTKRKTRPVLVIDVSADRSHTSIAIGAMGVDMIVLVRVVEYQPGTHWVVDKVIEMRDGIPGVKEPLDIAAVIVDAVGPARSLVLDLQNNYIDVVQTTAQEMIGACGSFYDAVDNAAVSHFGEPCLELAVAGAEKRVLLDSWAWTRTKSAEETGADISPLVACTLAYWGQLKFGDDGLEEFPGSFRG